MANYATLKAAIAAAIKENGNKEITGNLLQQQLLAMVNSLGAGYQFIDVATPATVPGTPDQNVFYVAFQPGIYANFGATEIKAGQIGIFKYNGTWDNDVSSIIDLPLIEVIKDILINTENAKYQDKYFDTTSAAIGNVFNENNLITNQDVVGTIINVKQGDVIKTIGLQFLSAIEYAIVTDATYKIQQKIQLDSVNPEQEITCNFDGYFIVFWEKSENTFIYNKTQSLQGQITEIRQNPENNLLGLTSIDPYIVNQYYNRNGVIINDQTAVGWACTGLMEIIGGRPIITVGANRSVLSQLLWFDKNGNFISNYDNLQDGNRLLIIQPSDIPANAKYFAVNKNVSAGGFVSYLSINSIMRNALSSDDFAYLRENKILLDDTQNWEINYYYNVSGVKTYLQGSFATLDFSLEKNKLYYFRVWLRNDLMTIPLLDASKNTIDIFVPRTKTEQYFDFFLYNTKYSYIGLTCPASEIGNDKKYYYAFGSIVGTNLTKTYQKRDSIRISDIIPIGKSRAIKIGFLGDSTTDGNTTTDWTVANGHENFDAGHGGIGVTKYVWPYAYPALLQDILNRETGNTNIECYNIGYSGKNSEWAYKNIAAILDGAYSDMDILVFRLGINDRYDGSTLRETMDKFKYYSTIIIEECIKRGITPVMSTPQPTMECGNRGGSTNEGYRIADCIIPVIKRLAYAYNLEILDLNQYFKEIFMRQVYVANQVMPDKLHFTDLGHKLEAQWYAGKIISRVWDIDGLEHFGYLNDCVRSVINVENQLLTDAEWGYYASLTPSANAVIYDANVTLTDNVTYYAVYNGALALYIDGVAQDITQDFVLQAGFHNIKVLATAASQISFYGFKKR